ncbi:GSCFA domain-containing protein [uncultured Prevotella sp.]|uniref:GSCFA domain-containing protein n=1 Tax=uncultured Prevotella sp. TaxID=159272 RepID=UPI0027E2B3CD|nr:GSCFA domain-containing protein [uncultured Prevotella sp.]
MQFSTPVNIPLAGFSIEPCERMLFVGSCFADNIGQRFVADKFRAVVNPDGVMYNPASILHTVDRYVDRLETEDAEAPSTAVFTLGTNHVYILNETGEIVDNCRKRPQRLFTERELTVDECAEYLCRAIGKLRSVNPDVRVVLTVSPIRYAKYGFHGSQLSKAVLLLAADKVVREHDMVEYFPAYEIVNDELRDYRFYREDMLHPSDQAVEYIWQRFGDTYFSEHTRSFLEEWRPVKAALGHRPFNADSEEHKEFLRKTMEKADALKAKYKGFEMP